MQAKSVARCADNADHSGSAPPLPLASGLRGASEPFQFTG